MAVGSTPRCAVADRCDTCGHALRIGDFPFCGPEGHARGKSAVHQDSVEGGFWAENGFKAPRFFESRKAHRDALAAEGKEIAAKWSGPGDQHLSRMDAPCATTLENARILLTRGTVPALVDHDDPIDVTTVTFAKDA